MQVVVRNDSGKTIPNVAVTVTSDDDAKGGAGFTTRSTAADLADPTRPLWIVDEGPRGGDTAYVSTWALGPLPAGRTKTFEWHVTPVVAGTHMLRWHVAAGLNGKAVARTANGQDRRRHLPRARRQQAGAGEGRPEDGRHRQRERQQQLIRQSARFAVRTVVAEGRRCSAGGRQPVKRGGGPQARAGGPQTAPTSGVAAR